MKSQLVRLHGCHRHHGEGALQIARQGVPTLRNDTHSILRPNRQRSGFSSLTSLHCERSAGWHTTERGMRWCGRKRLRQRPSSRWEATSRGYMPSAGHHLSRYVPVPKQVAQDMYCESACMVVGGQRCSGGTGWQVPDVGQVCTERWCWGGRARPSAGHLHGKDEKELIDELRS